MNKQVKRTTPITQITKDFLYDKKMLINTLPYLLSKDKSKIDSRKFTKLTEKIEKFKNIPYFLIDNIIPMYEDESSKDIGITHDFLNDEEMLNKVRPYLLSNEDSLDEDSLDEDKIKLLHKYIDWNTGYTFIPSSILKYIFSNDPESLLMSEIHEESYEDDKYYNECGCHESNCTCHIIPYFDDRSYYEKMEDLEDSSWGYISNYEQEGSYSSDDDVTHDSNIHER